MSDAVVVDMGIGNLGSIVNMGRAAGSRFLVFTPTGDLTGKKMLY